jgi:hypothetical protein
VYPVVDADDFSKISENLRKLHAPNAVASGPYYQLCSRKTGFVDPNVPVWSPSMNYAPILVSTNSQKKSGTPDWRFTLGFGQQFDLGSSAMDHYCAGFVYSAESNRCPRTMLTYLSLTKKASALQDKKLVESIRQFPFRLLRLCDIMGAHASGYCWRYQRLGRIIANSRGLLPVDSRSFFARRNPPLSLLSQQQRGFSYFVPFQH